ncbi:MAG: translational GTPase TypA [Erysipelotrichales bacterium]|nr:translational GTPase TypA [Erysipelotrichales bacterium]MBQ5543156.1 translational GTPase TypA [Erysipelotrichales bacterium]
MEHQKIINIAVIAHVDAGKSTLVDAFLKQSGVFREGEKVVDCVMDSNALERERGITIYSKNCSVQYKDYKINIVDTPGHADFSSEVERIIRTVDTVILLVDASEGPMPQTRYVLQKSLELGLRPILLINKIDKKDQRAIEVVDLVYELFLELNATDEQLDFPILYGIAREGIVKERITDPNNGIVPLFETIIRHCKEYPNLDREPLQMQVCSLAYDDYIGREGIGRVYRGTLHQGDRVTICRYDGLVTAGTVSQLYVYKGLSRVPVKEAQSGEIVLIAGIPDITIGETLCELDNPNPMPMIPIEEPTLSMNFMVNTSPFAGRSGKYVTSRNIRERLAKELEVNVGLKVEETETTDTFKVSGRGELHLTVLIEQMRREGYELGVSRPQVIIKNIDGKKYEPVESVIVSCPTEYSGTVIQKLSIRQGLMTDMDDDGSFVKMTFEVPTRGLIGYNSEFINDTHGEGTMIRRYKDYEPYKGEINDRSNGVMISNATGPAMTYSIWKLQDHGLFFVGPGEDIYEGQIVGICSKDMDMKVNPTVNKKMTAIRSTGNDEAMKLVPKRVLTIESAVEFIGDDELVEITPDAIRVRKRFLTDLDRRRAMREAKKLAEQGE